VFRSRIVVSVATLVSFLLPTWGQSTPVLSPSSQALKLPAWLAPAPDARDEHFHAGTDEVSSSYQVQKSTADVLAYYRTQLQKAEVRFSSSFDGIGAVLRCSEGKASCVIQIRERDEGTSVRVSYSPNEAPAQPSFVVPPPPVSAPTGAPVPAPVSPRKAVEDYPTVREVEYEITGTVHWVNLTRKNKDGSTEQRQEKLPYRDEFYALPGTPLYLSVQKARITKTEDGMITRTTVVDDGIEGTVHVLIRVNGAVLQEAEATAPYGIATASGEVSK
jgi:hypothetical protein